MALNLNLCRYRFIRVFISLADKLKNTMKKLFVLLFVFPLLFSCGDDSPKNENNLSVEIREFDDPLFCQCMQYETDLLNAVIDGPHDAMKN